MEKEFEDLAYHIKQLLDEEPNIILECKECNNNEHFQIGFNIVWMELEKGSNQIKDLSGETRCYKPTDIVIICNKCKKIILETCI